MNEKGRCNVFAIIYGLSVGEFVIWAIVVAGIVAIGVIVFRAMGWSPPPWAVSIFWVVVMVVVEIFAIRFIMSM